MPTPSKSSYPENQENLTKICNYPTCLLKGHPQPIDNFYKSSKGLHKRQGWCKVCMSAHAKLPPKKSRSNGTEKPAFKVCTRENCPHDGILQPISNFHKDCNVINGVSGPCKTCNNLDQKKWASEHKDISNRLCREYYEQNKESAKEAGREDWKVRGEEINERRRERYKVHRKMDTKEIESFHQRKSGRQVKWDWSKYNWAVYSIGRCKASAKRKGIPFGMEPSDLLDKRTGALPVFCPIFTHIRLDYQAGPDRRKWASVDKIVPELGYTSGNVWVVSHSANLWKSNGSNPEERKRIVSIMNGRKKQKHPITDQPSLFDGL